MLPSVARLKANSSEGEKPSFLETVSLITFLAGLLVAIGLLAALCWSAYALSCSLLPGASLLVRLCGSAVLAIWIPIAIFWALAPGHLFRIWVVTPLLGGFTWAIHRRWGQAAKAEFHSDIRKAREAWASLGWTRWLSLVVLLPTASLVLRGVGAPPLAWDALTYHLVHAARYVQTGGLAPERAPDAWGYYEYFPNGGDILWAWAMLSLRGPELVPVAGLLIHLALLLGVMACSREFGASRQGSFLLGLAATSSPSILPYVASAYVDSLVASLFSLGLLFLFRTARRPSAAPILMATAAWVTNAGVKQAALPFLAIALPILVVQLVLTLRPRSRALLVIAGLVGASLPGTAHYVRTGLETGNPLYPMSLFGTPGNEQLRLLLRGEFDQHLPQPSVKELAMRLVSETRSGYPHRNFGPGLILIGILALCGIPAMGRHQPPWLLILLGFAAINIVPMLSDDMSVYRFGLWYISGRLFGPAFLCIVLLCSRTSEGFGQFILAVAIVLSVAFSFPLGLGSIGWMQAGLVSLLAALSIVPIAMLWRRRIGPLPLVAASATGLVLFGAGLYGLRGWTRIPTYRAAFEGRTFDVHPLDPASVAWELWHYLDQASPLRLAVTGGFDTYGHNVFRFPLFGSRLQNRIEYVPVTQDGSVFDTWPPKPPTSPLDPEAWLHRLRQRRIDYVVVLPPVEVPELALMASRSERFRVIVPGSPHRGFAARLLHP